MFSSHISIATNHFQLHNHFDSLKCEYYVINAPWFFSPYFGYPPPQRVHMNEMAKIHMDFISKRYKVKYFINLSNYPFCRGNNVYYTFINIPDRRLSKNFIGNRVNCFSGVNKAAIMLAIYMGFDRIYLVGCDYTHIPSRSLHWYEKGEGISYPHNNYQKDFFGIAKEFIDITTITLDGTSELLESTTYKLHTGREPVYRENTELLSPEFLKPLSTWPGYSIY